MLAVIGHNDSSRLQAIQQTLQEHGQPPAKGFDYRQLLHHGIPNELRQWPGHIKIEAPGPDAAFEQALAQWHNPALPWRNDAGFIQGRSEYSQGWQRLLSKLPTNQGQYLNPPQDIALLANKWQCQQQLEAAGVNCPPQLGLFHSATETLQQLLQHNWHRAFIKPRYGASALGVMAWQGNNKRQSLWTHTELTASGAYLSTQLHRYDQKEDILRLLNIFSAEGLLAQRWIPKLQVNGHNSDLRILTINGRACHKVLRLAKGPITNLHLGNQRADATQLLPKSALEAAAQAAEQVAAVFPNCLYLGVDIALTQGALKPYVLEVNAFGDQLHHCQHLGLTTQQALIQHLYD